MPKLNIPMAHAYEEFSSMVRGDAELKDRVNIGHWIELKRRGPLRFAITHLGYLGGGFDPLVRARLRSILKAAAGKRRAAYSWRVTHRDREAQPEEVASLPAGFKSRFKPYPTRVVITFTPTKK
jgi:hypothetical protein